MAPAGTALMSVSVEALPPLDAGADEAGADEAAADEAAAEEGAELLLVTADEPHAESAATASARTAITATRSRGRLVLRPASADARQERRTTARRRCMKFPPIGSPSELDANLHKRLARCATDCLSYNMTGTLVLPTFGVNQDLRQ